MWLWLGSNPTLGTAKLGRGLCNGPRPGAEPTTWERLIARGLPAARTIFTPRSQKRDLHPIDEDQSLGTPDLGHRACSLYPRLSLSQMTVSLGDQHV